LQELLKSDGRGSDPRPSCSTNERASRTHWGATPACRDGPQLRGRATANIGARPAGCNGSGPLRRWPAVCRRLRSHDVSGAGTNSALSAFLRFGGFLFFQCARQCGHRPITGRNPCTPDIGVSVSSSLGDRGLCRWRDGPDARGGAEHRASTGACRADVPSGAETAMNQGDREMRAFDRMPRICTGCGFDAYAMAHKRRIHRAPR
jgi:hypothetical protein